MPQKFFFTTHAPDSLAIDSNHSVTAERFLRFWEAVEKDGEFRRVDKGPYVGGANLEKIKEYLLYERGTHGMSLWSDTNYGRFLCGCGKVHETVGPVFAFDQKEAEDILTIVGQAKTIEDISTEDQKYFDGTIIFSSYHKGELVEAPGRKRGKRISPANKYWAFNKTAGFAVFDVPAKLFSRAKTYVKVESDCGTTSIFTFEQKRGIRTIVTKFTVDTADLKKHFVENKKHIVEKKREGPSVFQIWRNHNYFILTYRLANRQIENQLADEGWVELTDNGNWVETEGHTHLQVYDEIERRLKEELQKPFPWTL